MANFEVRELNPTVGAEISGLDPSRDLDPETVGELRAVFDERGVLLLRLPDLAADDQAYLVGLLVGAQPPADRASSVANTYTYANFVTNRDEEGYAPFGRLLFHSDMMWSDAPCEVLSLYGYQVQPPSVPTIFTSTAHAWDTLPAGLRARVEGRTARHVTGQIARGDQQAELVVVHHEQERFTVQPVVREHPRTGRKLLYVSQQMTAGIEGLDPAASEELLEELFAHLYRPEVLLEHDWRQGDLVIWDNLATQHARGNVQLEGPERTLRKCLAPVQELSIGRPGLTRLGTS